MRCRHPAARGRGRRVFTAPWEISTAVAILHRDLQENDDQMASNSPTVTATGMRTSCLQPLEDRRILVIEDERDIAELIALHLRDRYAHVELCHDGKLGFELAKAESWDLLILDLRLPGMDNRFKLSIFSTTVLALGTGKTTSFHGND